VSHFSLKTTSVIKNSKNFRKGYFKKNGSLSKYSRLPMARAEESQAEDVIIPLSNCQGTFSDLISSSNTK